MLDPREAPFIVFAGIAILGLAVTFAWVRLFGNVKAAWRRPAAWVALILLLSEILLAHNGFLQHWDRRPPPMVAMLALIFVGIISVSQRFGPRLAELPLWKLVALQGFRLPLELVMHRAATSGIMPEPMTFTGYNFDIVTGITAIPVAYLLWRGSAPAWLAWVWNLLGSLLLAAIVAIAVAATPTFHYFGHGQLNTWIGHAPYVWLPGVLVPAALLGHLVIARKLLRRS